MTELRELALLLQELDEQMETCVRCGMCQAVCPLYAETGRETDVARGKIVLLEQLSREMLKDPKAVQERLEKCLLCGSCAAACPSGVDVLGVFFRARAFIAGYLGLGPAKKIFFRFLMSRPALFNSLVFMASRFQGLLIRTAGERADASCARFRSSLLTDRHFTPLARTPWHRRVPALDEPAGPGEEKVAVFPGCLVDKVFPGVAESVFRSLRHHGAKLYMPSGQACCGIPALSAGDMKAFIQLVRQNLRLFAQDDYQVLVTPCATCTAAIKVIWPAMGGFFSPQEQAEIKRISCKTMDITRFLGDKQQCPEKTPHEAAGPRRRITYHDPCHLKKTLNVHVQPRTLIRGDPGGIFTEMEEADRCCGMGGSFGIRHYDLSGQMGRRKTRNILQSGAEMVATACPACMLQLKDQLLREGSDISVVHVVQIYAQSLEKRNH